MHYSDPKCGGIIMVGLICQGLNLYNYVIIDSKPYMWQDPFRTVD